MPNRWASEKEAMYSYGISSVDHCPSCHAGDGEEMTTEVELPGGETAAVCCTLAIMIQKIQKGDRANEPNQP